jgi:hypothetical protein
VQLAKQKKLYWFKSKAYGWGWGLPAAWQGWVVVSIYASALVAGLIMISNPQYLLAYLVGITAVLIAIVVWKGERPLKWRWGKGP